MKGLVFAIAAGLVAALVAGVAAARMSSSSSSSGSGSPPPPGPPRSGSSSSSFTPPPGFRLMRSGEPTEAIRPDIARIFREGPEGWSTFDADGKTYGAFCKIDGLATSVVPYVYDPSSGPLEPPEPGDRLPVVPLPPNLDH